MSSSEANIPSPNNNSSGSAESSGSGGATANAAFDEVLAGGCGSVGPLPTPISQEERLKAKKENPLRAAWTPIPDGVTLYYGPVSQPSRSVYQMILESNFKYKAITINLRKLEQKSPDYLAHINPNGLVPAIYHGSDFLAESVDILHYLGGLNEESKKFDAACGTELRASIDHWLDFSGKTVRPVLTGVTRAIAVYRDPVKTKELKAEIPGLMETWENKLKNRANPSKFVCTQENPTIADFQLFHELNGPVALGLINMKNYKNVDEWLSLMHKRPCSEKAYGNVGFLMGVLRLWLGIKSFFGSTTGTL